MRRRSKVIAGVLVVAAALGLAGGLFLWGGGRRSEGMLLMTKQSANGQYRAEVYSWPVRVTQVPGEERYVRVVMVDEASGEVVWELEPKIRRKKGENWGHAEGLRVERLMVTNHGAAVIRDSFRRHLIVSKRQGGVVFSNTLRMPGDPRFEGMQGLVLPSTPTDTERPFGRFMRTALVLDESGKEFVVFRAPGGERLVFDAVSGEQQLLNGHEQAHDVSAVNSSTPFVKRVLSAILLEEEKWAIEILRREHARLDEEGTMLSEPSIEVFQAMFIAGRLKRPAMIELIRGMETKLLAADRTTLPWEWWLTMVRTALRRMDQPLGAWSGYDVRIADRTLAAGTIERDREIGAGLSSEQLIERADLVKIGMRRDEVAELLGGAEYRLIDVYEWDIDAVEPYTLAVEIKQDRVMSIEKVTPARWKFGSRRELP